MSVRKFYFTMVLILLLVNGIKPIGASSVYLSDLTPLSSLNGYGPMEKDMSNGENVAGDGHTIKLNNISYLKGLGTHSNSSVNYNLSSGNYSFFSSDVGIDDEVSGGSVKFQVYLDNLITYDSGVMYGSTNTKRVNISTLGKKDLKLVVNDGGDGKSGDHGDWANAILVTKDSNIGFNESSSQIIPKITISYGNSGMAPYVVHVNALNSEMDRQLLLTSKFDWDFGDPSSTYNHLRGWNAAHVYDSPGNYVITLTITDENGSRYERETPVSILPDERKVIYVSSSTGKYTNDGSSPSLAVNNISRVQQLMKDNTTVLFKRGDTFEGELTYPYLYYSNVVIGSYGTGDKPILRPKALRTSSTTKNLVIQDIAFDSGMPFSSDMYSVPDAISPYGQNILIRNVNFLHVGSAVMLDTLPKGVLILNNTEFRDSNHGGARRYFVWLGGSDISVVGNEINDAGIYAIRGGKYDRILIANNNVYESNRGGIAMQQGQYAYAFSNNITGIYNATTSAVTGTLSFGPAETSNYSSTDRSYWGVLDSNILHTTDIRVMAGTENVMIRENSVFLENQSSIFVGSVNPLINREIKNVLIMDNLGVQYSKKGRFIEIDNMNGKGFSDIKIRNNRYIAPNLGTPAYFPAPLYIKSDNLYGFSDISNNIWAFNGYYKGINYLSSKNSDTNGYKTSSQWNSFGNVKNDSFSSLGWDGKLASE